VKEDSTVVCWGLDTSGQLGVGDTDPRGGQVTAAGITNAVEVQARNEATCVLLADGTVKCWGLNEGGRLGTGVPGYAITTPTLVSGLSGVAQLSMGWEASCARKTDGTVWCWGNNYDGQVGDGTYTLRSTPVQITGLTNAKEIASGENHTCAVKEDSTVVCWGLDTSGQLGIGLHEIIEPVGVRMTCP
jgi:alpha-tubulin suppressor-like RCC1 family protein